MTITTIKPSFYKTLFIIALPIILQNLLQSLVNLIDTIMIGRLGATEIAAVGLGNQIFFLITLFLFGVGSGGAIFIAQYWGKRDIKGIHNTVGITLCFALFLTLIFTVVAVAVPEGIIGIYSTDKDVIHIGAEYLRLVAFSYIPMGLSFTLALAMRSTEQVKLPLYATIVSLLVNTTLNYIFIFTCNMGVRGAALGTVIARVIECIILVTIAYKRKLAIMGNPSELFGFTKSDWGCFLKIALPVIVNEGLWSLGITMQSVIMARAGTDAIAAFNITSTIFQLTWVYFIGVGNACAVIIGKKIGEKDESAARKTANHFAWFAPLSSVAVALIIIPIIYGLPLFFAVEHDILHQAALMLIVTMLFYPFKAFNMSMIVGICRAGGDTIFAALVDSGYLWLVAIPLGAFVAFVLGLAPWLIYLAFLSELALKSITCFFRLRSGKWLNNVTEQKGN